MADQAQTDEQKITGLETQVATLTKERDTLKELLEKVKTDSTGFKQQLATALDKNKELLTENSTLKQAKEAAEKQAEQALSVVGDLKNQLSDQAAGSKKIPVIKVGSKTYEFLSEFFYKEKLVTLELLQEDAALAAELVKEGMADLRLVDSKKA
ncbi:hypothetical protein GCM10028805_47400 [Spirosoma harenae]